MKVFKDRQGKQWEISITVGTIKRVKDILGINLLDAVSTDLLDTIRTDPVFLCDLLYAICKPQADRDGVTDIDFGEGLAGDSIADATDAFLSELVDFFPQSQRNLLRKALAKVEQAEKQMTETLDQQIDKILDQKIEAQVTDFTNSFGEQQEKSE